MMVCVKRKKQIASRTVLLTWVFVLLTFFFQSILSAQGFLKASGTKIVKGNGEEIILRGIGLGGWLVPEGYMLKTSGFADSPTAIKNKIIDLVGSSNANQFYDLYRQNYVNHKDIDAIAQWGFNSIRLPMHYELLTPKGQIGVYLEPGFAIIDSLLSWCESNSIYLILDLHCAPGGQNSANISDYSGSPSLWESTLYQQQTVALWKELARRYANKQWIGGYDLLNETVWNLGSANQPLRDLYIAITNAIRTVDQNHIIFIEGNQWANDFTGLTPAWDANMVYSFHKYWNTPDQNSINWVLSLRNSAQRPLWCGESGENSNQWFADCVAMFENNNIGWSWWPHKKLGSTSGLLSAHVTDGYNNLLKYWNNQITTRPSVSEAFNALMDQAVNLNISQCSINRGAIDALIRQPSTDATLPYTANTIPGILYAADYDLGKNTFAYKDNVYQNTTGNAGGAAWNSGGQYRNEGVDIETCGDWPTNGFDVGWIENGEYLVYTIQVQKTGTYDIALRVASTAEGGIVRFMLNSNYFGAFITIPNTGGWQSWQTVPAGQVYLNEGKNILRINFLIGGFNLNYIELSEAPTGVREESSIPHQFVLEQNYPNPFNPNTTLRFETPGNDNAKLLIFNVLGQYITTLFDQTAEAGKKYQIQFNASNIPSGIYFAILESNGQRRICKMSVVK